MYDRSEYDAAQRHFQALLAEAVLERNSLVEAQAQKWLGNVLLAYDKPTEALPWFEKSLSTLDKQRAIADSGRLPLPEVYEEEWRNVRSNIAVANKMLGNFEDAEQQFRDVLAEDERKGDAYKVAISLYNLADVHHQKSIRLLQKRDTVAFGASGLQALELLKQSLRTAPTADAYLNLGNVHAAAGRPDSAVASYRQAETLYGKAGYRVHRALALGNIGVLSLRLADTAAALDALQQSIVIVEELRGSISSIDIRSSFISNKFFIYENLIGILVQQGKFREAFEYVERAKARSFLDMLGNKAVGEGKQRSAEVLSLVQREQAIQKRIGALLTRPDSAARLGSALNEHQIVLAELRRLDPEYASVKSIEPLALEALQGLLDESTGLLEYFMGERSTIAFAITRDTVVVRRIQLKSDIGIEREIEVLRGMLFRDFPNQKLAVLREKRLSERLSPREALSAWRSTPTSNEWQLKLVNMYSRFFAPFAPALRDKAVLYIIPHGPLHHLPFQALIAPTDIDMSPGKHIGRPRFLIEKHAIAFLPSASVLPFALARELDTVRSALIVGDPVYADPKYRNRPLEAALIEADSVARRIPEPTVLTREQAEEALVKRKAGLYDVLHFATHGELSTRNPMESRILLAAAKPDSVNDGNLTVAKIFNLDLRALLVTLSACQTAQVTGEAGTFTTGDDLVGLSRSFMFAGTPAVIASLWIVDDAATLAWMRYFYDAWLSASLSRVQSSRAAALRMLNAPEDPDWIFPYYWSAFVYMGDTR
ncbi:MAG: CHAT domain-containing protein [Bacteroidia bacterium]|nr:CHAT domain-containing protein [Bacteroidia bacterium]